MIKIQKKTVRIYLTGGKSDSMHQAVTPTLIMLINNRMRKPSGDYENGIKVKAVKHTRPYPKAKTNYYIEGVKQFSKIENKDVAEIIYYDESQVFEGAGSNLFAVINNKLVTPKSNIVEGITRNVLLEILKISIPVDVRNFTFDELLQATEFFLTGSNSEVRGVVEMNGKIVGNGKVGEITKKVAKQYKEYILQTIK